MFVGHLAVAFLGKRARPALSLVWYIAAATLLDLLWPIFLLLGIERVSIVPGATAFTPLVFDWYPWSHSLLLSVIWGLLLAGLARSRWGGASSSTAAILFALVVSHWVLDFVTHAPDLPLWPGDSPRYGLGLWHSVPATLIIEGALWVAALAAYLRPRRARNRVGPVALGSLVLVATVIWAIGPWAPPPPSVTALAWMALIGGWVLLPWAAWADKGFEVRGERREG